MSGITKRSPYAMGCLGVSLMAGLLWARPAAASDGPPPSTVAPEQAVRAVLQRHCVDCHGEDRQKGGLRLDTLAWGLEDRKTFDAWVKVYDKIRTGEMPPADRTPPPADQVTPVLDALHGRLRQASLDHRQGEGRAPGRRLNRQEYENTLRDLLGLPGLRVKEHLPQDDKAHGFNKSGEALNTSYVHLARYMQVAQIALDAAIARSPEPPMHQTVRIDPYQEYWARVALAIGEMVPLVGMEADATWTIELSTRAIDDTEPISDAIGQLTEVLPRGFDLLSYSPRVPGQYRVRIPTYAFEWDKGKVLPAEREQALSVFISGRLIGTFDVPPNEPKVITFVERMEPGEVLRLGPATLPVVPIIVFPGKSKDYSGPGVAYQWVEVEGPIHDQWPPQSHRILFGDLPIVTWSRDSGTEPPAAPGPPRLPRMPHARLPEPTTGGQPVCSVHSDRPLEDAKRLLHGFTVKAFRQPTITDEQLQPYLSLVQHKLDEGVCFQDAMLLGYQAVLCSPDFLFIRPEPGELDGHALASRLSYFLWNSSPDDQLLALAVAGRLSQPAVLHEQVERLLDDPKSQRFIDDFCDQWLGLDQIHFTAPDARLYPEYLDRLLVDSMVDETRAFFAEMLGQDLSVLNVVDSDFAMLNSRLGRHYGVQGVVGVAVQRVDLPPDSLRGGLLTQGAVLKVTANGTTTSPVTRGVWVMDRILNQPPPPPPPAIPGIEPDIRGTTTIREQLAQHRASTSCAACHAKIDPAGFALEGFDVMGGVRERYRSMGKGDGVPGVYYRLAQPVDCTGELPDGRRFNGIREFKQLLLEDPDQITRNIVERLVVYATGAGINFADRDAIEQIVAATKAKGDGLRTLIHQVVQSPIFLNR